MQETNICASAHWVPLGAASLHAEGARAKDGEGTGAKESRLFVCLFVFSCNIFNAGLPGWLSGKETACPCRRHRFKTLIQKDPTFHGAVKHVCSGAHALQLLKSAARVLQQEKIPQ